MKKSYLNRTRVTFYLEADLLKEVEAYGKRHRISRMYGEEVVDITKTITTMIKIVLETEKLEDAIEYYRKKQNLSEEVTDEEIEQAIKKAFLAWSKEKEGK